MSPPAGHQGEHRWNHDDDEDRRQDQEHERYQQLDRRFLSLLLGHLTTALAHVDRKISHDLTDRYAEPFSLDHRAYERTQVRGVDALAHLIERFGQRCSHPLLLECEAHLLAERSAQPV